MYLRHISFGDMHRQMKALAQDTLLIILLSINIYVVIIMIINGAGFLYCDIRILLVFKMGLIIE